MKTTVFDIETIPQNEELLLARAPDFEPDSRLKDPVKIAESIEKQRSRYIEKAALDWKTAEVVLIGLGDGAEFLSVHGDEKTVIRDFLSLCHDLIMDGCKVGGHNVKGFDLPMLVNRARVHGLHVPQSVMDFWKGKPQWSENIFDTLELLAFGDRSRIEGNGVEDVAKALSLPGKLGHGADFPALWKQLPESAIAYNRRDVEIEIEIARMCGLI